MIAHWLPLAGAAHGSPMTSSSMLCGVWSPQPHESENETTVAGAIPVPSARLRFACGWNLASGAVVASPTTVEIVFVTVAVTPFESVTTSVTSKSPAPR